METYLWVPPHGVKTGDGQRSQPQQPPMACDALLPGARLQSRFAQLLRASATNAGNRAVGSQGSPSSSAQLQIRVLLGSSSADGNSRPPQLRQGLGPWASKIGTHPAAGLPEAHKCSDAGSRPTGAGARCFTTLQQPEQWNGGGWWEQCCGVGECAWCSSSTGGPSPVASPGCRPANAHAGSARLIDVRTHITIASVCCSSSSIMAGAACFANCKRPKALAGCVAMQAMQVGLPIMACPALQLLFANVRESEPSSIHNNHAPLHANVCCRPQPGLLHTLWHLVVPPTPTASCLTPMQDPCNVRVLACLTLAHLAPMQAARASGLAVRLKPSPTPSCLLACWAQVTLCLSLLLRRL